MERNTDTSFCAPAVTACMPHTRSSSIRVPYLILRSARWTKMNSSRSLAVGALFIASIARAVAAVCRCCRGTVAHPGPWISHGPRHHALAPLATCASPPAVAAPSCWTAHQLGYQIGWQRFRRPRAPRAALSRLATARRSGIGRGTVRALSGQLRRSVERSRMQKCARTRHRAAARTPTRSRA